MRILIIEDELPAARQLAKLIAQARPEARILDTLDSVAGAVQWFSVFPAPDLVFMDIQIADGLSFDIFKQVPVTAPVIFTTAYDHYAVQAFKVNAIDYLLKPIDPEEMERAIRKIAQQPAPAHSPDWSQILSIFDKKTYKDRFLVKSGQHFIMLLCSEIAFFRSSDGLTQAYTLQGKKHFVEHTLDELERLLNPSSFFRISRSMIVCTQAIRAIHPHLNGRLKLELSPSSPEEAFVSRERAPEFKTWLGG